MLLSRQFHPRIGALAAVNMSKRQQDTNSHLEEPLLHSEALHVEQRSAATSRAASRAATRPVSRQVSDVSGQRLLSAMDMLKPILAESPPDDQTVLGRLQPTNSSQHGQSSGAGVRDSRPVTFSGIV